MQARKGLQEKSLEDWVKRSKRGKIFTKQRYF